MEEIIHAQKQALSEKDLLISFGYKAHQIIEFQDGSAVLDEEQLRRDYIVRLKNRRLAQKK